MILDETFIEMERGAKALDLHDVNTAAVCLRKALEGHVAMAPPGPTPPPQAVGPMAEIGKSINALEVKDFSLSALCGEKAAAGLEGRLPENILQALKDAARAIRGQDFGSAANYLRVIVRYYRPQMTLPEPAAQPPRPQKAPGQGGPSPAASASASPVAPIAEQPALIPRF